MLRKRLRSPAAGGLHLRFHPGFRTATKSEDIIRAAIGYVYELRKERKPISNPSLQFSFQCSIRYAVRRCVDDINFSINVEALQLHSIDGSSKGVIRQDIEGALASYQNALDDPKCVYKPFCPFGVRTIMYNLTLLLNAANARTADMRRSFNAWITSLTVIRDSGYRGRVQRETLTRKLWRDDGFFFFG